MKNLQIILDFSRFISHALPIPFIFVTFFARKTLYIFCHILLMTKLKIFRNICVLHFDCIYPEQVDGYIVVI